MAGLRRYFLSESPLRERLENILSDVPDRSVSLVGQAPLSGGQVSEWDFESPASWRWTCGITAGEPGLDPEGQMRRIFEKYEEILAGEYMCVAEHCVRTWIYVRNIDDNYGGVVKGRKDYFESIGLTPDTHYIASTGIEGTHINPGVTVMMDALAIPDLAPGSLSYLKASGNMSRTIDYGVTFERGVAFSYGERRFTMISGTASIDESGKTLHTGDVERQTLRTLENIEVLLSEDGASMSDIASALVYLRNPEDSRTVREIIDKRFPRLNYLMLHGPVCRPEWLVEIECIAVRTLSSR